MARSKRGIKSIGFGGLFGRRSTRPAGLPDTVPVSTPRPKPAPPLKSQPGPAPKLSGSGFRDAGKTVIIANKIKANDEVMMTNLRRQAPLSVAEAAKRVIDAESLIKAGVVSTGPNASRVARDAFISAGITGVVSAPINVAAYAGSVATGETIKSSYAPGVLPPPFLPGASSQPKTGTPLQSEAEHSTTTDSVKARLEDFEVKLLGMASAVMFMLGDTSSVFTKNASWPSDDVGRLSNLEKLLGLSEQHFKKAARQNGLVFKPYKPGEKIPEDPKERLDLIERKFNPLAAAYEKLRFLAAMKAQERKAEASTTV
ncbi:hypothetical protein RHM66_13685 [Pseudomonas sp. RTB3]|nr:hypothetical protein RHM66_13685 [Pseudomonas sp. RTB3]